MNIGKRIREARLERGISQKKLANAVGIKQPTLSELETGESKSTTNIAKFAAVLGVNPLWLETGKGNKYNGSSSNSENKAKNLIEIRKGVVNTGNDIYSYNIAYLEEKYNIYLNSECLIDKNITQSKLISIQINEKNMEPNLNEGDIAIIDLSDTEPIDSKVYIVNYEGKIAVHRLIRDQGKWWIESDSPNKHLYPRKIITHHICSIIGRVIKKITNNI